MGSSAPPAGQDVVVVGAGSVGLAVAEAASVAGARVRVLDPAEPGAGTSSVAAGILSPTDVAEWGGDLGALHLRAAQAWPGFAERLAATSDVDPCLRRDGSLRVDVGDEAGGRWLAATTAAMDRLGVPHELVEPAGARRLVPGLRTVAAAVYCPTDAAVDTRRLVAAQREAVRRSGVVVERMAVRGLTRRGAQVTGVELEDGTSRPADAVVLAMGAWSGAAGWLPPELRPPVEPVAGEAVRARGDTPVAPMLVRTLRGSVSPRSGGEVWLGTTLRRVGFVTAPNVTATVGLLTRLTRLLPAVGDLELLDVRVGLRPVSRDGFPFVGPVEPAPGVVLATGHGRDGILHLPLTAAAVVAHLSGGPVPDWAEPLRPRRSRWAEGEPPVASAADGGERAPVRGHQPFPRGGARGA